jgi:hypothetical protein
LDGGVVVVVDGEWTNNDKVLADSSSDSRSKQWRAYNQDFAIFLVQSINQHHTQRNPPLNQLQPVTRQG